jgi:PhoPQ-activated pathogenicity-related protein
MSDQTTLPSDGVYYIVCDSTGKYLDMSDGNTAPNTPVIAWDGHGLLNQQVRSSLNSLVVLFLYDKTLPVHSGYFRGMVIRVFSKANYPLRRYLSPPPDMQRSVDTDQWAPF